MYYSLEVVTRTVVGVHRVTVVSTRVRVKVDDEYYLVFGSEDR